MSDWSVLLGVIPVSKKFDLALSMVALSIQKCWKTESKNLVFYICMYCVFRICIVFKWKRFCCTVYIPVLTVTFAVMKLSSFKREYKTIILMAIIKKHSLEDIMQCCERNFCNFNIFLSQFFYTGCSAKIVCSQMMMSENWIFSQIKIVDLGWFSWKWNNTLSQK